MFLVIRCFQGYGQTQIPYKMTQVSDEAYQAILQFYQYDKDIPFNVQIVELVENDKKELFFYESGHQLPAEHAHEAAKWIFKYL